jgi:hypothetical protein
MPEPDEDQSLSDRERARLKRRDRKRETRMVVDNAGVKRVQRAISERATPSESKSAKPQA